MKKILVNALLWAVAGLLPISAAWATQAASPMHEKIDLHGVKTVSVDGNFKVVLTQGIEEGMTLSAPEEVMPKISVKQSGTKVEISIKGKLKQNYEPFEIAMTLEQPEQITLKGSAVMTLENGFSCKKMSVEMSGNTAFSGEIQTIDKISVKMSDRAELKGSLTSTKGETVELSGYAKMDVRGHAPVFTLTQSNSSRFGSRDFHTDKATVKMSNMSAAGFTATKFLNVSVADGAVLTYGGAPKTKVSTSGTAKVQPF